MPSRRDRQPTFPFGVASGDPTTSSVNLWTYCSLGNADVEWWIRDQVRDRERRGSTRGNECVVRVRVDGLEPGTRFTYGFGTGTERSAEGSTRTLSTAPTSLRLAVVCCARWPDGPFEVYRRVAELQPDLVLHLGDYIYADGGGGRRGDHQPNRPCVSAEDYRTRYVQYRSDQDLQALHGAAPWIAIWDDHEFTNDAWRTGARGAGSGAAWEPRRRAATEAFQAWMPQEPHGNGPTPVDRWIKFGSLADLIAIDCRMAGRERPRGGAGTPTLTPTRAHRLLSDEQWAWLDACLEQATGSELLLATSVQFAPLRLAAVPALRKVPVSWLINPDQWDGYPDERRKLLDLLRRHDRLEARVLSGDLHGRFHAQWRKNGVVISEVTTPAVSSPCFAEQVRRLTGPVPPSFLATWLRLLNPHLNHVDLTSHGASLLTIDSSGVTVTPVVGGG